jgi:hypothetical protein
VKLQDINLLVIIIKITPEEHSDGNNQQKDNLFPGNSIFSFGKVLFTHKAASVYNSKILKFIL